MTALKILILVGPQAGKTILLTDPVITLGRARENTIVIDLPFISRRHAAIERLDWAWQLVNHSPNGAELGKHHVGKKPRRFTDEQTLSIGDTAVLRLSPLPGDAAPADPAVPPAAQEDDDNQASRPALTGRIRLWIGIGIYLLVMLALFIFFATLKDTPTPSSLGAAELNVAQIRQQIRQPPPERAPNPRLAAQALRQATTMFHAIDAQPDALFRAYRAYRRAAAYSPNHTLENALDLGRYQSVRQWLIDRVTRQYQSAITSLKDGHYDRAAKDFATLLEMYPDYGSPLFQNLQQHLDHARRASRNRS